MILKRFFLQENLRKDLKEFAERLCVIEKGLSQYTKVRFEEVLGKKNVSEILTKDLQDLSKKLYVYNPAKDPKEVPISSDEPSTENDQIILDSFHNAQTSTSTKTINKSKQSPVKFSSVKEKIETIGTIHTDIPPIELSEKDKELLRKLEQEHEQKIRQQKTTGSEKFDNEQSAQSVNIESTEDQKQKILRPIAHEKPKDTVSINKLCNK